MLQEKRGLQKKPCIFVMEDDRGVPKPCDADVGVKQGYSKKKPCSCCWRTTGAYKNLALLMLEEKNGLQNNLAFLLLQDDRVYKKTLRC